MVVETLSEETKIIRPDEPYKDVLAFLKTGEV